MLESDPTSQRPPARYCLLVSYLIPFLLRYDSVVFENGEIWKRELWWTKKYIPVLNVSRLEMDTLLHCLWRNRLIRLWMCQCYNTGSVLVVVEYGKNKDYY